MKDINTLDYFKTFGIDMLFAVVLSAVIGLFNYAIGWPNDHTWLVSWAAVIWIRTYDLRKIAEKQAKHEKDGDDDQG